METLAERLKYASKKAGINQAKLARLCGVKPPSVSDWFSGKTKKLEGMNLFNASRALSVRPEWLADGKGPMQSSSNSVSETTSHYEASHFSLLVVGELSKKSRFSPYQSTNAEALICGRNQYILTIEDHSYAPRLRRGDRVLIDPERRPAQNDDLVITTSENKVLIHCLIREDSTTFELIDSSVPGSQLIIRKSQVKKVEVIAAIIPESSMPNIERRTMEDRLREIYPPDENTW